MLAIEIYRWPTSDCNGRNEHSRSVGVSSQKERGNYNSISILGCMYILMGDPQGGYDCFHYKVV